MRRSATMLFLALYTAILAAAPAPQDASGAAPRLDAPASAPEKGELEARVRELTLDNGWRFLLVPLPGAPVVAFETYADVGSVHDPAGRTGMAHLFGRMAYRGSDRVGTKSWQAERVELAELEERQRELLEARVDGDADTVTRAEEAFRAARARAAGHVSEHDFSRLLQDAGGTGTMRAIASVDATRYVVSLPSNQIERWCWVESERFWRPVLREFYRERDDALEERRALVDSNPLRLVLERLRLAAFEIHPYRRPTLGLARDVAATSRTELEDFFRNHYGARRLVTAIVGDIDPERLARMLERYFARVPAGPKSLSVAERIATEPAAEGERRVDVPFPAAPLVAMAWRAPERTHTDSAAIEAAVRILGGGPGSRLAQRLIRDDGSAARVTATGEWPGSRYPSLSLVVAVPIAGVEPRLLESAIDEEVARLAKDGPSAPELAGAARSAEAALLRSLRDPAALAALLARHESQTGDWRDAFTRPAELSSLSAEDVRGAVARYFGRDGRTVATLVAPGAPPTPENDR